MTIEELYDLLRQAPEWESSAKMLKQGKTQHLLWSHLYASARAIGIAAVSQFLQRPLLIVMDSADEAQYLYADLQALKSAALFFPSSHRRRQGPDEAMAIQRTEVLTSLSTFDFERSGLSTLIVSYPEALTEPVPARQQLTDHTFTLRQGETMAISDLATMLAEMNFTRVDFVYEPGQYSVRGGIVDIYSYSHDDPYRLDFFGNEIDSIRTFDIENQLSKDRVPSATIVSDCQSTTDNQQSSIITDYLPEGTIWCSNDFQMVKFRMGDAAELPNLAELTTLEFNDKSFFSTFTELTFRTQPQPLFHKNFELLFEDLRQKIEAGYHLYILADQKKQTDRLKAIFEDQIPFQAVDKTLHAGWIDETHHIACYTDHQIFERYHRVSLSSENARRGKAIVTLKEINQLREDDYIVHSDHGIGRFGGLVHTMVNGRDQEMVKLIFRDGDTLFVSIHNLHRLSKYKGKEGSEPTISKLGSGAWERLKERTKDKVKDIARDLIRLYATRKKQGGVAYSPDGYIQHELEASFLYEDTPDQAKATLDVKRDLESKMPMDRLICGDVGFGKTEVAMRAACKVASDGKQVAVLVPTTVLALQHYNTFKERFANIPLTIEYLSRAKTVTETKDILQRLAEGKIDILIGTHKLVGKNVQWHDLGLLIIDEEQKFGVAVKEKLKTLRTNVDVLTLTATPIPRTLQFSLLGARDLSVITTPPPNRYPVQTELIGPEDEDIIKEAINLEMERNGQIFVVNNRIEMLDRIEAKLHKLCPQARIVTAHGQMPTDEMETRLEAFINYDYDILVSTTIIESGVDIPNVNTMIIFSAQNFGLADLHQLRGRVGRSNRKAYCYLVTPDRELLTPEARRRLDAISTFGELGAGFHLALQDLDIRGAGNLLGAEQSGFIAELGYETYQRILNEAVEELKEEEHLTDLSDDLEEPNQAKEDRNWSSDCQLETDLPISFPESYIENISERISLYRELDSLRSEAELTAYTSRLIDRFGPLPQEAQELLEVVRLRWLCCRLGIEKIFLKGEQMTLYFTTHNPSYWQSDTFGTLLNFLLSRSERCRLVEEKNRQTNLPTGRRYAVVRDVRTISGAIFFLTKAMA